MPLLDIFRSYREQLRVALKTLDRSKYWAFALWRPGPEADLPALEYGDWPISFLQAGGGAGRMTLEVRYVEDDGVQRQYVVGRPGD